MSLILNEKVLKTNVEKKNKIDSFLDAAGYMDSVNETPIGECISMIFHRCRYPARFKEKGPPPFLISRTASCSPANVFKVLRDLID